jgi:putative DNA primase/helicase
MSIFERFLGHVITLPSNQKASHNVPAIGEPKRLVRPQPGSPPTPARASQSDPQVDGAVLLDEIAAALRRHIILPDGAAETIALFAAHAHAHDAAQISPLLVIHSPDVGCGKTSLLSALAALTPEPLFTSDLTAAGLYRSLSRCKHTVLIDEGETALIASKTLHSLLNSGHRNASARVVRADGIFDVWCPKIVALVGELPRSLRDRSIRIFLERKRQNEEVAPLDRAAISHLTDLSARAAIWASQQHDRLASANPLLPNGMTNRLADNWRTLLAIAEVAGQHWPDLTRVLAAKAAAATAGDGSPAAMLLSDLQNLSRFVDRLPTAEIIDFLTEQEDRPWGGYNNGRGITPYQVAKLLRPFGIAPRTIRFGDTAAKGYLFTDFQNAFDRYL